MNKFLLSTLATLVLAGSAGAYEIATPTMMKSVKQTDKKLQRVKGSDEITLALPMKSGKDDKYGMQFKAAKPSENPFTAKNTRAEEEEDLFMEFSYAGDPYGILGLGDLDGSKTVYMAIQFPEEATEMYDGCYIKNVRIVTGEYGNSGENRITRATVFTANNLNDIPDKFTHSKSNKVTKDANVWANLVFDEDILIKKGEPFYIGYAVTPQSSDDYFLWVDGMGSESAAGSLIAIQDGNEPLTDESWLSTATQYGNLCIYLTIVGDNLPKNGALIYGIDFPVQVNPGEDFNAAVTVINVNANPITSFDYSYKIGNAETVTGTLEYADGIPYYSSLAMPLPNLNTEEIGLDIPFIFSITKVNGVDNYFQEVTDGLTFDCFELENGFTSHALIEEGTGTWCGYCPIGISMMEYAVAEYPDYYNRVALHYDQNPQNTDPMYVESTAPMLQYFDGFPMAWIDRIVDFSPFDYKVILPLYKDIYDETQITDKDGNVIETIDIKAPAEIKNITVEPKENGKVSITTDMAFAMDIENPDMYRVGFYITENNVGPYKQVNFFPEMGPGFDGWEDVGNPIKKQMYDDVARDLIGGAEGCENSLPEQIKIGETYSYTAEGNLLAVTGDEYTVIAFIVDNRYGRILNSLAVTASKSADVESVQIADNVKAYGVNGGIVVTGDFEKAEVYAIDGSHVAQILSQGYTSVPAGVYVVTVNGKSYKVISK